MLEVTPARDYSGRMRVAAYLSLPALFFASTIAAIPLIMWAIVRGSDPTDVSILAALLLTVVAELLVIVVALAFVGRLRSPRDILGRDRTLVTDRGEEDPSYKSDQLSSICSKLKRTFQGNPRSM